MREWVFSGSTGVSGILRQMGLSVDREMGNRPLAGGVQAGAEIWNSA